MFFNNKTEKLNRRLRKAIERGNTGAMIAAIKAGADIHKKDPAIFEYAVKNEMDKATNYLITHEAKLPYFEGKDVKEESEWLYNWVKDADETTMTIIIANCLSPKIFHFRELCYVAARKGYISTIETAFKAKAKPEIMEGGPALHAAMEGHLNILKLMEANNVDCTIEDKNGFNGFELAIRGGHIEVMSWLHKRGIPIVENSVYGTFNPDQPKALTWLLENGLDFDKALDHAACQESTKIIEAVINYGLKNGHDDCISVATARAELAKQNELAEYLTNTLHKNQQSKRATAARNRRNKLHNSIKNTKF